ncbi:MAG TPA: Ig-like domain-containing protein [Fibrobacteria bacterium]|nr:Ig-like domain-containing protein [Fibrobacteria bacterium]
MPLPYPRRRATFAASALAALSLLAACVQEPEGTHYVPNPPTVIHIDPAHLETGVATDQVVTATFSQVLDPATLNANNFILLRATPFGFDTVQGAVTYDAGTSTATFDPNVDLLADETYIARLLHGITNVECDTLADTSWTFTTGTPPPAPVLDTTDFGDPTFLRVYWFQSAGATSYHLQVSTSPLFTTLVNDQPSIPDPAFFIVEGHVPATAIPAGTYYWRVSASGPGGTSAWSNVKSFVSGYN